MRGWCMATLISQLVTTNANIDGLKADFAGLNKLDKIIEDTLRRLEVRGEVQTGMRMVKSGTWSVQDFDGWFAPLARAELGKVLGIIRNKAKQKAQQAGAGSAAGAVMRRMYRDSLTANINIAGHHGRLSSRSRVVPEPNGGESGIRRERTVKKRTMQLRKYYGPDRDFILRILESGRDVYMATSDGPIGRGSKATYGKRGAMAPRNWFFHSMKGDMEQAAQQLGTTLTKAVETWVEQKFTESTQ